MNAQDFINRKFQKVYHVGGYNFNFGFDAKTLEWVSFGVPADPIIHITEAVVKSAGKKRVLFITNSGETSKKSLFHVMPEHPNWFKTLGEAVEYAESIMGNNPDLSIFLRNAFLEDFAAYKADTPEKIK